MEAHMIYLVSRMKLSEKARRDMAQAERHARLDTTGRAMIRVLMNSAVLATTRNDRAGSRPALEDAVRLARGVGSPRTEAIVLGDNYELSFTSRQDAIYTKDRLLEPVPAESMLTPRKVDAGVFTRSVPEMKDPTD